MTLSFSRNTPLGARTRHNDVHPRARGKLIDLRSDLGGQILVVVVKESRICPLGCFEADIPGACAALWAIVHIQAYLISRPECITEGPLARRIGPVINHDDLKGTVGLRTHTIDRADRPFWPIVCRNNDADEFAFTLQFSASFVYHCRL